jgi:ribosome-binding factor A
VAEIASLALGSSRDSRLQGLLVHSVSVASHGARLMIRVEPSFAPDLEGLEELMAALEAARGWMRSEIAEGIQRKHTPEVAFEVVLGGGPPE